MPDYCSRQEFVRDYSEAIKNASAALFIGSGLSRDAKAYDWKNLLREAANDINLDVDKEEHDLISLAQYYVNGRKRTKINEAISKCFKDIINPAENHFLLASMPISSYWTTNYDKLIENAFSKLNISTMVLTDDDSLKKFTDGKDVIIRKLHGDVDNPSDCVITKHDYEEFAYKHEILLAQLKGEMCAKTFLFLGYSFSDTDINHILTRIRLFYKGEPPKRHFCIMKEASDGDEYGKFKQSHIIRDLIEYGIHTVLVKEYSEITEMLKEIRHRIYAKNVYISGAYEEDGSNISEYARQISKWLTSEGYKIYTGYGKNLGADIVAGGFDGCTTIDQNTAPKKFNETVFLFPFPYKQDMTPEERKAFYTQLRKNALLNTHITIVINGTKKENGVITNSPGCIEEADLSLKQGNLVIPIEVTGGAASEIWNEINKSGSDYSTLAEFQALRGGTTFDDVIVAIKKIITSSLKQDK
ncbi:MAG: SIR2 family protein [Anaerovoracaceae bacterium]